MYKSVFVIFVLLSVAFATTPILVTECGTLAVPYSTYTLANDIAVRNTTFGYVCFDILGTGIVLNGNGFKLSSASDTMLPATGVRYSGAGAVVTNMQISNLRTGIHAKGTYGEVCNNTISHAINGIDVSATHNKIHHNIIGQFEADESASGIYVYFPAIAPVDSYINITNNIISDIQGDVFALGISVYYATSVSVANNHIYNLRGGLSTQEISVIHGHIDSVANSFVAPVEEGSYVQSITMLASVIALVASFVFFRSSSISSASSTPVPVHVALDESEDEMEDEIEQEREITEAERQKERDREMYGGEKEEGEASMDSVSPRTMSFSLKSSMSSPLVR